MKILIIPLTIVLALLAVALIFVSAQMINFEDKKETPQKYSYTTAICEGDFCQDHVVVCDGEDVVSTTPITGAAITVPNGWQDPRNAEDTEKFCNLSDNS